MEYKCNECNKQYSSYQSLWIHNKKFHYNNNKNNILANSGQLLVNSGSTFGQLLVNSGSTSGQVSKDYSCKYCNKKYLIKQSKWKHEKNCKNKNEIIKIENNNNITNNNHTQINNGTINNKTIIINQIGKESFDCLPMKDISKIIKDGNNSPITCIEKLNFNKKLPQNHSFCTTTLEGNHFTTINPDTQTPEKVNKKDFINKILSSALNFINNIAFMIEFDEEFRNKISKEEQQQIKDIVDNMSKFYEPKNKRAFFHSINDMSYNFKSLILNTWELLKPQELIDSSEEYDSDDSGEQLIDPNFKHYSDSSDSD